MNCRHCGSPLEQTFLDLGAAPPSNSYLKSLTEAETYYPLHIKVCHSCWLVQTLDFAKREEFFSADYAYFSSFSTTWLEHARQYVDEVVSKYGLNQNSLVVEIASNDGYLLQYVKERGIPCVGIEPTKSTANAALAKGIATISEFFGLSLANDLASERGRADLIIANNVLAHVPDINDFVAGVKVMLAKDGVATFEFPSLLSMVGGCQFDTAYHEHYSYLSLVACEQFFAKAGLEVYDALKLPTHGGSYRINVSHVGRQEKTEGFRQAIAEEKAFGLATPDFYKTLQLEADRIRDELRVFLQRAKSSGQVVVGYGAAAKGNTLLNYCGVRSDQIAYVVDANPAKCGTYLPGSRIPVVDTLGEADTIVVLPWNLSSEIISLVRNELDFTGNIVTFIPSYREVTN